MSMTNTQAAELVKMLHGAYPGSYFDGAVAEVFTNSLLTCDYERALDAVAHWTKTVDHFPTIVELNGVMRRQAQRDAEMDNVRQLRQPNEPTPKEVAAAAFERGYRKGRTEAGDTEDEIVRKLDVHLRSWKLHPTSAEGPLAHAD